MLSARELLDYKKKPTPVVYSLGQKECEQCTNFDASQLEAKLQNVAELLSLERVRMKGMLSKAIWLPEKGKAEVMEKVGSIWNHFGHSEDKKAYVYPEEALYLIDIGALELTYNNLALSLQRAYFLLTNTEMTLEKYRVFSQLSLLGYRVMRHSPKNVLTKYERGIELHKVGVKHRDRHVAENSDKQPTIGEEIEPAKVKSQTNEDRPPEDSKLAIMTRLQSIGPTKDPCASLQAPSVDFDVFQAGNSVRFRKSTVQLPAFRVMVFTSTEEPPDLIELCRARNHFEDGVPLITAVVHPDHINFMQIAAFDIPTLS